MFINDTGKKLNSVQEFSTELINSVQKLNSVQEFLKIKASQLLIFSTCLHDQLNFNYNVLKLRVQMFKQADSSSRQKKILLLSTSFTEKRFLIEVLKPAERSLKIFMFL